MNFLDPIWTDLPQGINRATMYPYDAPNESFLLDKGILKPLTNTFQLAEKIPILAIGSNRSPSQLLRKFGKKETVAVTKIIIQNFDVIYASLISYYGAIPATLWPVKGSEVKLSIIWLSNSQLKKMHETEAVGKAYDFVEFDHQSINFKSSHEIKGTIYGYVAKFGALNFNPLDFEVKALSAIKAKKRVISSINQQKALKFLANRIINRKSKKDIILFRDKVISDKEYRLRVIKKLNRVGVQPQNLPWKIIDNIQTKSIKFY